MSSINTYKNLLANRLNQNVMQKEQDITNGKFLK